MIDDFKNFILRGNVVDLAVGVIMMPVIGAITGGLDFSNYYISLSNSITDNMSYAQAKQVGAVIGYGQFITVAVNFLIIASVLFVVIKFFEKLKKEKPQIPAPPSKSEQLLQDIRDAICGHEE